MIIADQAKWLCVKINKMEWASFTATFVVGANFKSASRILITATG